MLVRITNSCRMGCTHCMIEATPEGGHMSVDTFKDTAAFNAKFDPYLLFISGGEPTDHPQFLEILKIAKSFKDAGRVAAVLVASNGMFLENKAYTKEILKFKIPFQITNDPSYYPKRINKVDHPLFVYEHSIQLVSPIGRAASNKLETKRQSPLCFNLRSLNLKYGVFIFAVKHLRSIMKMCSPSINIDGSVVAGESSSCYKFGTVNSPDEELSRNLSNMKCGKCNLHKNLQGIYANLWDEMEGV